MRCLSCLLFVCTTLVLGVTTAFAESPRSLYQNVCGECHERDYFAEEDRDQVARTIAKINRGEIKHKEKFRRLTDEEVEALATFLAGGHE